MFNRKSLALAVLATAALMLPGCYAYPAYTPVQVASSVPASFDASWQAARGAAYDEGVRITYEDRASGTLRGDKGSASVLISVATQANGSVRVAFTVTGAETQEAGLQDGLTRAYRTRMGR